MYYNFILWIGYSAIYAQKNRSYLFLNVHFAKFYNLPRQEQGLYVAKNVIGSVQKNEKDPITMIKMYQLLDPMMFPTLKRFLIKKIAYKKFLIKNWRTSFFGLAPRLHIEAKFWVTTVCKCLKVLKMNSVGSKMGR